MQKLSKKQQIINMYIESLKKFYAEKNETEKTNRAWESCAIQDILEEVFSVPYETIEKCHNVAKKG